MRKILNFVTTGAIFASILFVSLLASNETQDEFTGVSLAIVLGFFWGLYHAYLIHRQVMQELAARIAHAIQQAHQRQQEKNDAAGE